MKGLTECEIPEQLLSALTMRTVEDGVGYLRVRIVDGLYQIEVLGRTDGHCTTCQCKNIADDRPAHPAHPEIKREKPWHHG